MTSINFKVIGLTQPGSEPTRFVFLDLPKQEMGILLIQLSHLVRWDGDDVLVCECVCGTGFHRVAMVVGKVPPLCVCGGVEMLCLYVCVKPGRVLMDTCSYTWRQ